MSSGGVKLERGQSKGDLLMAEIEMQRSPQPNVEGGELLMEMPSFRSISGGQEWPRLLLGYIHEVDDAGQPPEGEEEEEFEFASVSRDSLDELEPVDADGPFSDGHIRPVYPLFGRAFVLDEGDGKSQISKVRTGDDGGDGDNADSIRKSEESVGVCLSFRDFMTGDGGDLSTSSSSSSSATRELSQELGGVPTASYCVWTPVSAPASPDLRKKSNSAGASSATSKKWRLSNLVSRRSQSDGKERFVLVATPASSPAETAEKKDKTKAKPLPAATTAAAAEQKKGKAAGRGGGRVVTEMDMATAHRLYYTKDGAAAGDRRRSFLPYRKDLFGFFAHVNAPGRGFHLF